MDEVTREARGRGEWFAFAALLVLAAILRFYRLGAEGLWLDEVLSLGQAPASLADAVARFWALEGFGRPLSLYPLSLAMRLGDSESVLRLPYALFSVADVAVVYLVARRLAGRWTALAAMAFLAVSPLHVWYAQEVRWYAQWSFFTTLSFLLLVGARSGGRITTWAGYAGALVASFYTFVIAIFVAFIQVVSTWLFALAGGGKRQLARQHAALLAASLLSFPAYAMAFGYNPGPGTVVGTPRAYTLFELPYVFFTYGAGFTVGPTVAELHRNRDPAWIFGTFPEILVFALVFGVPLLLGLRRAWKSPRIATVLLPWAIGLPVLVVAVSMVTGQTFNARYAFPGLTAFMVILAMGCESCARERVRAAAVCGVLLLSGVSLASYYWNPRYDKEQVREAVELIERSAFSDAPVGFVGQGDVVVDYYGPELDLRSPLACAASTDVARVYGTETIEDEAVAWLMVSRDWSDRADGCLEELRRAHRVTAHEEFIGVELWRLERSGEPAAEGR